MAKNYQTQAEEDNHMAPVDCTGLAEAADTRWLCKHCGLVHRNKVRLVMILGYIGIREGKKV